MLNDIATCTYRDEGQFEEMYNEILYLEAQCLRCKQMMPVHFTWYVLKALEDWIPNKDFVCGWADALQLHETEIAEEGSDSPLIIPSASQKP